MRKLCIPFITCFFITIWMMASSVFATNFQKGFSAYGAGDYQTAFEEFYPLAQVGDAIAQNNLGVMYHLGQGVAQDDAEAAQWRKIDPKRLDNTATITVATEALVIGTICPD